MTSQGSDPAPLDVSETSEHSAVEASKTKETVQQKHKTISCTQCRKRKLKCDRTKPSCGTCSRLQHPCVYPEGRMKSTARRRNVKDLEARLAQVESLLSSEVGSKLSSRKLPIGSGRPETYSEIEQDGYWNDLDLDVSMATETSGTAYELSSCPSMPPSSRVDQYMSNELIGFGLQENLPSQDIIDELHTLYFARIHPSAPTFPKYRYLANVKFPPPLGPPICLRYAVWAVAAATSAKYSNLQDIYYQRARRYAEADEMKGQGEHFITVSHAQCWALISNYEAQTMYLSRAWVSGGKSIRLVQMMNLHRLDGGGERVKQIIAPAKDWMDLEERRRTFWSAFCCDRYSCAGTGWPMTIDERDISTRLPSSEEAYELGHEEVTTTLSDAMTAEGAARVSPYAGVVLMACLFGHNWLHLHRPTLNDHPGDHANGEFWKRHRRMDATLVNTLTFLPERLGLPAGMHDPNIVFLNMNLHASTICLHQAAVSKAEKHNLDPRIIKHSQARCRASALQIVNIMRLISSFDIAEMNAWVSFNLYVATGVLIEGCTSPETSQESRINLDFLLAALEAIGRQHIVTKAFVAQLKIDLEIAGLSSPFVESNTQEVFVEPMGAPSIAFHNIKGRVSVSSNDQINQTIISNGDFRTGHVSAASYKASGKNLERSEDLRNMTSDLRGILPRQDITEKLRRTKNSVPSRQVNQNEQGTGQSLANLFSLPSIFEKHPLSADHGVENVSGSSESQHESFPPPSSDQQQFMQSGNRGNKAVQDGDGFFSNNSYSGMPSNLPFTSFENAEITQSSSFQFSSMEGQDFNDFLNGVSWNGPTFQA